MITIPKFLLGDRVKLISLWPEEKDATVEGEVEELHENGISLFGMGYFDLGARLDPGPHYDKRHWNIDLITKVHQPPRTVITFGYATYENGLNFVVAGADHLIPLEPIIQMGIWTWESVLTTLGPNYAITARPV